MRGLIFLFLIAALGCDAGVGVAPTAEADDIAAKGAQRIVPNPLGTIWLPPADPSFIPCLGEEVQYAGYATLPGFLLITPSGNVIDHVGIDYKTDDPFRFTGLTSGDEWTLQMGEDSSQLLTDINYVAKPNGNAGGTWFYQANEAYVHGKSRVQVRYMWMAHVDAEGNFTDRQYVDEWRCQLRD